MTVLKVTSVKELGSPERDITITLCPKRGGGGKERNQICVFFVAHTSVERKSLRHFLDKKGLYKVSQQEQTRYF